LGGAALRSRPSRPEWRPVGSTARLVVRTRRRSRPAQTGRRSPARRPVQTSSASSRSRSLRPTSRTRTPAPPNSPGLHRRRSGASRTDLGQRHVFVSPATRGHVGKKSPGGPEPAKFDRLRRFFGAPRPRPIGTEFFASRASRTVGGGAVRMDRGARPPVVDFTYAPQGTTLTRAATKTVGTSAPTCPTTVSRALRSDRRTPAGSSWQGRKQAPGIFQTGRRLRRRHPTTARRRNVNSTKTCSDPGCFRPARTRRRLLRLSNVPTLNGVRRHSQPDRSEPESGRIVNTEPPGHVFQLAGHLLTPGNPLDVPGQQARGTWARRPRLLYVVKRETGGGDIEPTRVGVYATAFRSGTSGPRAPSRCKTRSNAIPENTNTATASRFRRRFAITTTAFSTNTLTVRRASTAASFEVERHRHFGT